MHISIIVFLLLSASLSAMEIDTGEGISNIPKEPFAPNNKIELIMSRSDCTNPSGVEIKKPNILIVTKQHPDYTADYENGEVKALVKSGLFNVSWYADKQITNAAQLEKLSPWMKNSNIKTYYGKLPENLNQFDLVLAQYGNKGEDIAKLIEEKKFNGILVTRFRGASEEKIGLSYASHFENLKKHGTLYLPNCAFFLEKLTKEFGFDPNKFLVHVSAVDVKALQNSISSAPQKSLSDQQIRILSIGRFVPKKDFNRAIKALANVLIASAGKFGPIQYDIIGEGPQQQKLEDTIKKLNLSSHVRLLGGMTKEQVMQELTKSDILIAASTTAKDGDVEGTMNVFKEAGLVKQPLAVLASDHAGAPEIIKHDVSGVIAQQGNLWDLTEKLLYVLNNKNKWTLWHQNLNKEVMENYDGKKVHPILIKTLNELIQNRNKKTETNKLLRNTI